MKPADFQEATPGRLVKSPEGYWAFVPAPLPSKIDFHADLITALSAADRAIGQLSGVAEMLPNPHLLIGPFMRREAVLSSRIEGTQSSLLDLFLFEAAPSVEPSVPDVREVANYVRALEYGLRRRAELPISLRLIRELHQRLMEGMRGNERAPGEFRRSQNWIGRPGCTLRNAMYVPPPPLEMSQALNDFEKYLHEPSGTPPLVRLATIHYQFEAIHPFLDGNGRISRLLITLLLCVEGILIEPLLYLSAYFERHREEYYDRLLGVSRAGRWSEWVMFFLNGIAEQSTDAVKRSNRLLQLRDQYREQLQSLRPSALSVRLIDDMFSYPATTVARTAESLGITRRSAQSNIDKLTEAGILREATGRKRNRIFVADGIVHVIEDPQDGPSRGDVGASEADTL